VSFCVSLSIANSPDMKPYTIKKGNHYANISLFEKLFSFGWKVKRSAYNFKFHSECWWAPPRNSDDNDLNKLCGIGYGTNHQENSARLAWRPDFNVPGKIEIYGYVYDQQSGGHISKYITSVQTGVNCTGLITSTDTTYVIMVNAVSVTMQNNIKDPNLCFHLYPYFGGNNTAPHDMVIELEFI
jgi:hypothetical protein